MTKTGWRPIETAPKGEVLLYFPEVGRGTRNHHLAMYRIGNAKGYPYRRPSHWAPLEPPSESTMHDPASGCVA